MDATDIDDIGTFDSDIDDINVNNNYSCDVVGRLVKDVKRKHPKIQKDSKRCLIYKKPRETTFATVLTLVIVKIFILNSIIQKKPQSLEALKSWSHLGSNQGPPDYESGALTN